jgi:hypothetical protein
VAKEESKPNVGTMDQGGGNKVGGNQSLPRASITTVAVAAVGGGRGGPRGNKRPCQPSNSDDGGTKCPVHNSMHHSASEYQEIKKLMEQFRKNM